MIIMDLYFVKNWHNNVLFYVARLIVKIIFDRSHVNRDILSKKGLRGAALSSEI